MKSWVRVTTLFTMASGGNPVSGMRGVSIELTPSSGLPEPEVCESGCLHENEESGKMIRCCACLKRFHNDCMGESSTFKGSWSCPTCRDSARLIKLLSREVCHLKSIVSSFPSTLDDIKQILMKQSDEIRNIRAINTELTKQISEKDAQYKLKSDQYDQLNEEYIKLLSQGSSHPERRIEKERTLLLGSSLVSDIHSKDSSVLDVQCNPGASLSHLTDELSKIKASYDHIIVVGGGNDCCNREYTSSDVTKSMSDLLTKASEKASKITVSSILPRPKEPAVHLKMDHVNEQIKKLCQDTPKYNFVDNDGSFKLADMTPNEAFFVDGVHTSFLGTKKLVSNLGLSDICNITRSREGYAKSSGTVRTEHQLSSKRYHIHSDRRDGQQVRCYTYEEPGHISRTCRLKQQIRCFICGILGHKSSRCTFSYNG